MKQFYNKAINLFRDPESKRVSGNVISLTLLNGIYFVSPLILIPYLLRTVGSDAYGQYIFSWTFIYYFIFLVNYGFDLSSTREIAIHRNDIDKVSDIYSATFYTRMLLLFISLIIMLICLVFIGKINQNSQLILMGLGVIVGQAFFPTWLFQGMEKMKFITIVNTIIRIAPIVLIFIFVKSDSDIKFVILFQALGFLVGGLFSHFFALHYFKLHLYKPEIIKVMESLKSGWSLFLSTVGISLYRETNTVILGFVTGSFEVVGYFALADKVIRVVQLVANTFSQALFPYFGYNLVENPIHAIRQFKKIGKYYSLFLVLCSLFLFIVVDWILKIYLGNVYPEIVTDVRIMTPVIVIGGLNYYFGVIGMVNMNHKSAFSVFVLIAGIFNILFCVFLGRIFFDTGASISVLMSETVLFVLIIGYLQMKQKIFFK